MKGIPQGSKEKLIMKFLKKTLYNELYNGLYVTIGINGNFLADGG